jgi:TRAP-type mannitol/chloroaromatic compound transport system permease large subunit
MSWLVAAVLVLSFVVLLAIGIPIAFCIGISTGLTMLLSVKSLSVTTTVAQRVATGIDSFTLLAIPLFILAGQP